MNFLDSLKKQLEKHLATKPEYPLYGHVSLEDHVRWSKAFRAWMDTRDRLEMQIFMASPKDVVMNWNGTINHSGFYDKLDRPRGVCAKPRPKKDREPFLERPKVVPKDEEHAKRLEYHKQYRKKRNARQSLGD